MRRLLVLMAGLFLQACAEPSDELSPNELAPNELSTPMDIAELRTARFAGALLREHDLDDGPGYSAYLAAYTHADLALHVMVAVPTQAPPEEGFPVLIANHGYVPDPQKYGITADGSNIRPGDYYRSVPELYASRGFLVVIPDYRGHNSLGRFRLRRSAGRQLGCVLRGGRGRIDGRARRPRERNPRPRLHVVSLAGRAGIDACATGNRHCQGIVILVNDDA